MGLRAAPIGCKTAAFNVIDLPAHTPYHPRARQRQEILPRPTPHAERPYSPDHHQDAHRLTLPASRPSTGTPDAFLTT